MLGGYITFKKSVSNHPSWILNWKTGWCGIGFFWFSSLGIKFQNSYSYLTFDVHLGIIALSIVVVKKFNKKIQ